LQPDSSAVICVTGNGLKSIEVMKGQCAQAPVIGAKLAEFDELVRQIHEPPAPARIGGGARSSTV
jgi:hypothetical protein